MNHTGRIHSIESCGTVDGPGIRFVVFMQGCPLRCQYCHNPDTWSPKGGKEVSVPDLMKDIVKYKSYMRFSGGGVTISGGEPMLQAAFILELIEACKKEDIHTAVDTSGFIFNDQAKAVYRAVDMVLLDVKHAYPNQYKVITGVDLAPTLKTLEYLDELNKPTWVRYVLVPTLSDQPEAIEALAQILSNHRNITRIEVLPFHKMGEYKWETMGLSYHLEKVSEPDKASIVTAMGILKSKNLNVQLG